MRLKKHRIWRIRLRIFAVVLNSVLDMEEVWAEETGQMMHSMQKVSSYSALIFNPFLLLFVGAKVSISQLRS